MTKSYIKKVSFKLFLEGVQVRCRTQWRRKLIQRAELLNSSWPTRDQ